MKKLFLIALLPGWAFAQDLVTHGADVYSKTCSNGYCHGPKGTGGAAPRLAARGFDAEYIARTIRLGVVGTTMPAFGTVLSRLDAASVAAYVGTLNGIAAPRALTADRGPAPRTLPPEAARGRALFYEASRGFGRCSVCHQVDGMGIAITEPIAKIPDSVTALREAASPHVVTATVDGFTFPALVLSKGVQQIKLFDFSVLPPSLRTLPAASVKIREGSDWAHASVVKPYSDAELTAVLAWLRVASAAQ